MPCRVVWLLINVLSDYTGVNAVTIASRRLRMSNIKRFAKRLVNNLHYLTSKNFF